LRAVFAARIFGLVQPLSEAAADLLIGSLSKSAGTGIACGATGRDNEEVRVFPAKL